MQNSQLNSLAVPATGSQDPATLHKAANLPIRIVVNNLGPNLVLLAHDPGTLSATPAFANVFRLKTDKEVVIVLAPGQGLFAAAVGASGSVSIAVSEALPIS